MLASTLLLNLSMGRPTHCSILALLMIAPACGGEDLDRCVEERVTIDRGIYGQLLNGCDTEDCESTYAVNLELRLYDESPIPGVQPGQDIYDHNSDLTPIQSTESGAEGFYQLRLDAGTYYLCSNVCTEVTLASTEPLVRLDWASGPGGGHWWTGQCD